MLEGIFDLSPTRGILSDVQICVVLISVICVFCIFVPKVHVCFIMGSDSSFWEGFLFRSSGYDGRLQMKSCSVSGEVLLTHRLSEHIFCWGPDTGRGVVRDQVFPQSGAGPWFWTQQCRPPSKLLPCERPGELYPTIHSLWERGIPGLALCCLPLFINPKGVRDCCDGYIWQNHQIFFFSFERNGFKPQPTHQLSSLQSFSLGLF